MQTCTRLFNWVPCAITWHVRDQNNGASVEGMVVEIIYWRNTEAQVYGDGSASFFVPSSGSENWDFKYHSLCSQAVACF